MGEIADLLDQAMWDMYVDLIEQGLSPEEAHKRVLAVDWSCYNLFAGDQAELALWEEIEEAERRETREATDAYPGKPVRIVAKPASAAIIIRYRRSGMQEVLR